MKKFACLLVSFFAASALTGCGSDSGDVALGMAKAVAAGDAALMEMRLNERKQQNELNQKK